MSQKMIVRSFWSILLVVYLIVGYVRQAMFVRTEWAPDATILDKFASYYLDGFILNIVPAFVIALILGFVLNYYMTNRSSSNNGHSTSKGKYTSSNGKGKR